MQRLQVVYPAVHVQVAPYEVFKLLGGCGVSVRSSYIAEEPVQTVFFLAYALPKLREMGVPNLVQRFLSIVRDPVTSQDVTPFDKMLIQKLPQRLETCDFLQPLYDPVEIQFRICRHAGYSGEHTPLHVA